MSRVFVAEELALGRRVVVKVLDREMAQGLSAERFALEAQLAAVSGVDSRQRLASLDSMLALGPIGLRVGSALERLERQSAGR